MRPHTLASSPGTCIIRHPLLSPRVYLGVPTAHTCHGMRVCVCWEVISGTTGRAFSHSQLCRTNELCVLRKQRTQIRTRTCGISADWKSICLHLPRSELADGVKTVNCIQVGGGGAHLRCGELCVCVCVSIRQRKWMFVMRDGNNHMVFASGMN